jgi:hypothetical protein
MQAAEDGPRFDAPEGVNWSPRRRILVQGQVCSAPIVVARITAQQMEKVGQRPLDARSRPTTGFRAGHVAGSTGRTEASLHVGLISVGMACQLP